MAHAEQWLPVRDYTGFYEVSDLGRVRSVERTVPTRSGGQKRLASKVISPGRRKSGHLWVALHRDGRSTFRSVHRLVLEAFVGAAPPDTECRHRNGDPGDNRLANLRWGTRSDNTCDAVSHGTHGQTRKTHCPQGHAYTPENTLRANANARRCKICHYAANERRRAVRRAAARLQVPS